jgi:hypothetical protein
MGDPVATALGSDTLQRQPRRLSPACAGLIHFWFDPGADAQVLRLRALRALSEVSQVADCTRKPLGESQPGLLIPFAYANSTDFRAQIRVRIEVSTIRVSRWDKDASSENQLRNAIFETPSSHMAM